MSIAFAALLLLQSVVVKAGIDVRLGQLAKRATTAAPGCTTVAEALYYCSSAIPGFDQLPYSQAASCLCYDGTTWVPNLFDSAVLDCASYAKTADISDYSDYVSLESFCAKEGDVVNGGSPKTTSATTTAQTSPRTAAATTTTAAGSTAASVTLATTGPITACISIDSATSSCEAATSNWINLPGSQQASCVCYSGTKWTPDVFDSEILVCANYLKTAIPSDYPNWASLEGFCSDKGDVVAATTGSSVTVIQNTPLSNSFGGSSTPTKTGTTTGKTTGTTTGTTNSTPTTLSTGSTSTPVTSTKSGGAGALGSEGRIMFVAASLALAALGMCVFL